MNKEIEEEISSEDYLDMEFPKGQNKYRGAAMVLRAYSKLEERNALLNKLEEEVEKSRVDLHGLHAGTDMLQIGIREGINESSSDIKSIIAKLKRGQE